MTKIDQLIRESKQLTTDLMALRHEMQRPGSRLSVFGGPRDRADLIYGNAQQITKEIWELSHPEPMHIRRSETGRELGDGKLLLTETCNE